MGRLLSPTDAAQISDHRLRSGPKPALGFKHRRGRDSALTVRTVQCVPTMMHDMPKDDLFDDRVGIVACQRNVTVLTVAGLVVDDFVGRQNDAVMFAMVALFEGSNQEAFYLGNETRFTSPGSLTTPTINRGNSNSVRHADRLATFTLKALYNTAQGAPKRRPWAVLYNAFSV